MKRDWNGWTGRILRIDLRSAEIRTDELSGELYSLLVGGKGLAGHYLFEFLAAGPEPREKTPPLMLMTGPLVGTSSPTSGRCTFMSLSPLTGAICDCSVGGRLGTQLKRAGYDGVVLEGTTPGEQMLGLSIADTEITLEEGAEGLEGSECSTVLRHLVPERSEWSVTCIGEAAHNGVRFAGIMVDGGYTAGRGGLGLVMARKGLKYIRVRGSGTVGIADRAELRRAREEIFRLVAASPVLTGEHGLASYGTGAVYDLMHSRRMMPTSNFRKTRFEHATEMNAPALRRRFPSSADGCRGCHIRCKRISERTGSHLPEFETMSHLSALLDNRSVSSMIRGSSICNELGMDTISAGATLACYAELEDRKLSADEIPALLEEIALGSSERGRELGKGSLDYARKRGRPELSMSVKGMELPAYDPRGAYGMALAYATSTRGGCHLRAYPISHEILRRPVATDRFSFEGKARIVKIAEDANAMVDSLTACKFTFFAATLEEYARAFSAVTGIQSSPEELLRKGERIYFRERMMNCILGFRASDDDLPARFFEEEGSSGEGIHVGPIDRQDFLRARDNYYVVRGLDSDAVPQREVSCELNLSDCYDTMNSMTRNG